MEHEQAPADEEERLTPFGHCTGCQCPCNWCTHQPGTYEHPFTEDELEEYLNTYKRKENQ